MSARQGGHRAIGGALFATEGATRPVTLTEPIATRNQVVLLRRLSHDIRTVNDKVLTYGVDETGTHGDLQVMLATLLRMTVIVRSLIELEETR